MDIGVRELKQRLSEFLDRAERGEVIRVTDRGRPKALLVPMPGRGRLAEGIEEGWVMPGSGSLRPIHREQSPRTVASVLAEDRDGD